MTIQDNDIKALYEQLADKSKQRLLILDKLDDIDLEMETIRNQIRQARGFDWVLHQDLATEQALWTYGSKK